MIKRLRSCYFGPVTLSVFILIFFFFSNNYFKSKPILGVTLDNDLKLAAQYGSMTKWKKLEFTSFFHLVICFTAL